MSATQTRLTRRSSKRQGRRAKKGAKGGRCLRGWVPWSVAAYQNELDAKLQQIEAITDDLEQKCVGIETVLVDVAEKCQRQLAEDSEQNGETHKRIHELISKRREARRARQKELVKETSKNIQRELRAFQRAKKSAEISKVLTEFKKLQRLVDIRNDGRKTCMRSIWDEEGVEKTDKYDIAEVFASFFESLYDGDGTDIVECVGVDPILAVSTEEIRLQL